MNMKRLAGMKAVVYLVAAALLLLTALVACQPKEPPTPTTPAVTTPPATTPTTPPATTLTTPPVTTPTTPAVTTPPATTPTTPPATTPTTPPATTAPAAEDFKFTGTIESMGADAWVIGGKTFKVTATTVLDTGLAVGVSATVDFTIVNGENVASQIETPVSGVGPAEDFKFTGTIESMGADAWVIGGKTFKVTATTVLDTGLAVGVSATVDFTVVNGENVASQIETP